MFLNQIPTSCTIKEYQGTQDSYSPDKIFTLVSLPKAILSDQGSNFMSGIFQQVICQVGIPRSPRKVPPNTQEYAAD